MNSIMSSFPHAKATRRHTAGSTSVLWLLGAILLLHAIGPTEAQTGRPRFTFEPDPPFAGEPFLMTLHSYLSCDPRFVDLHLRTIVVVGNRIDVYVPVDFVPCDLSNPVDLNYPIPMDGLPAGEYEVVVHALRVQTGQSEPFRGTALTVVPRPVTAPPPPQLIPTLGVGGLALLALTLALFAIWHGRRGE